MKTTIQIFFICLMTMGCQKNLKSDFKPTVKIFTMGGIHSQVAEILSPDEVYAYYMHTGSIVYAMGEIEATDAFYSPYDPIQVALTVKKIVNAHNQQCGMNAPQVTWSEAQIRQSIEVNSNSPLEKNMSALKYTILNAKCKPHHFTWVAGLPQSMLRERYNNDPDEAHMSGAGSVYKAFGYSYH